MNTSSPYERRDDRCLPGESHAPAAPSQDEVEALAVHRDPSVRARSVASEPDRSRPSVSWVRPTELPTLVGGAWVRRGIDLQAELVRRARRAPVNATRHAGRRITRSAIARPEPASPTEGLQL